MVSAVKSSARALRNHILQASSRSRAFLQGQGGAGQRFAPKRAGNNDAQIGSRLDNGESLTKDGKQFKRYKFQLNKDAENATIKEYAGKDSHKVWAQVDVEIKENPTQEESEAAVNQAFDGIEDQL